MTDLNLILTTGPLGFEVYVDRSSGAAYMTQNMLARLLDIDSVYLRRWRQKQGGDKIDLKSAEILTGGGIQGGTLYDEKLITDAIIEFADKDLQRRVFKAGVRVLLYQAGGYQIDAKPSSKLQPFQDRRLHPQKTPVGTWCVFNEANSFYQWVSEAVDFELDERTLVDGSIGTRWKCYRAEAGITNPVGKYTCEFKDHRGSRSANCFLHEEWATFQNWLERVYKPHWFPIYLKGKVGKKKAIKLLEEAGMGNEARKALAPFSRPPQPLLPPGS